MNKLFDEKWLDSLPETVVDNMEQLNVEVIEVICKRLKYFGDLRPTEVKKLSNALSFLGADMKKIEQIIKKYTGISAEQVKEILNTAAAESDEFAKQYYEYRGIKPITYSEVSYLQNIYRAISESTAEQFSNLSDTYGFKFKGAKAVSLRKAYITAVDKAVYEIQAGITDYHTAIRSTVKELADSGVRVIRESTGESIIKWDSGYSRRVDTNAGMNILDAVRRLNQEIMLYHGEQYGSDGVELSAHAISAPDHSSVQGRQFSNENFNKMQAGQSFEDIRGNKYTGFSRPIGEWNCKHFAFPIVIGVSEPAYTDKQLEDLKENSIKKYDITQEMRRRETELRRLKDRRMAYSASGNELDALRTQREINIKQREYNKYCAENGLMPKPERTNTVGYKPISILQKSLTKKTENGIMNSKGEGKMNLEIDSFTPCLKDLKTGEIVQTTYALASREEIQKLKNWKFNWLDKSLGDTEIYKLIIKDSNEIQGLISLSNHRRDSAVYVNIAESAPHNFGTNKEYEGVGGHLFAIAVSKSIELGYGGFVFMDAKNTDLVKHYSDKLGAVLLGRPHPYRMFINEQAAAKLIKTYTLEEI